MVNIHALLDYLSDGDFHSGEDIAAHFKVSRTAIWKQIKKLNAMLSSDIASVSGKGYQLSESMAVLNADTILFYTLKRLHSELHQVEVLLECTSTNQYLLDKIENSSLENYLLLSELQTAGRGRRGRQWVSPFASNIYMSLSWVLAISISQMAGLSLVVAISLAVAMRNNGIENVKLKWPNDIYVDGRKLAGVLLELRGESNSPCRAVMGMGINVNMPQEAGECIDQLWIDMKSLLGASVNRNKVIGSVLNELIPNLKLFEDKGFSAFMERWKEFDLLENKVVDISGHASLTSGIARSVDSQGALIVEFENEPHHIYSGEVSIRLN